MLDANTGRRVLIVDDDPQIRFIVRLLLEDAEIEVVGEASDGVEAIPRAVESHPQVILLDQVMPARNGEETAAILRRVAPGSRILAFSASIDNRPYWADAFLRKTDIAEIGSAVKKVIDLN